MPININRFEYQCFTSYQHGYDKMPIKQRIYIIYLCHESINKNTKSPFIGMEKGANQQARLLRKNRR